MARAVPLQRLPPRRAHRAELLGLGYWINDPWRYRLPPAGYGQRWVRHYDDVLLIDTRRGVVLRVINSFYW